MSRKKSRVSQAKATKSAKKGPAVNMKAAEKMEKDFRATPATIAAMYGKELAAICKQEAKLSKELTKCEAQCKSTQNKAARLAEKANAKKQVMMLTKLAASLTKKMAELTSQLEKVKSLNCQVAQKQAKYSDLGKQLLQLEKQLDAKAKMPKAMTAKSRNKSMKKVPVVASEPMHETMMPATSSDVFESEVTEEAMEETN